MPTEDPTDPNPTAPTGEGGAPDKPTAESKKTESQEHMIPKSRLDEEIAKRSKAEKELDKFLKAEDERKKAELSETERLRQEKADLEKQNADLLLKQWKRDAAAEAKLPANCADRLQGATLEELQEDAMRFAEALPKPAKNAVLTATAPADGQAKGETIEQQRARIHGDGGNPFDPKAAQALGGGVIWNAPVKPTDEG